MAIREKRPPRREMMREIDEAPAAQRKYAQVGQGYQGGEVSKLKQLLAASGFGGFKMTDKFGANAVKALKSYQRAAGLSPTGVADDATWEKLLRKFDAQTPSGNPYNPFEQSPGQADLGALEGSRPGEYESPYQDRIEQMLSSILSRERFSYNPADDPVYQGYRDQYQGLGSAAMRDAMGQAAALTGGYGNSYAASVGNQAYQGMLDKLSGRSLDLYDRALGRYQDEGSAMGARLSHLSALEQAAYGRYRDTYGDWRGDRDYAFDKTQAEQAQAQWEKEYLLALQKLRRGR